MPMAEALRPMFVLWFVMLRAESVLAPSIVTWPLPMMPMLKSLNSKGL